MKDKFKVTISVGGRFHAFYLADQLHKRDLLDRLITSYPKFETVKYGIPKSKIRTILIKEILERSWSNLPYFLRSLYNPRYLSSEIFDTLASKKIGTPDIFVGLSSKSLYSLREAQQKDAVTVIDHGSAHPQYIENILEEEHNKYDKDHFIRTPDKLMNKTLQEYEEADYIALPSKFAVRTFRDKGFSKEKLLHIPYGVDLSEFKEVKKEDDTFRVIFAGGMTLQKGVHYLLKSFAELDLPNSKLMLLGSKSEEIEYFFEKYRDHFNFEGHKPQDQLYKYYSQGSVYVQPSIQDGFGMVIIQAMACGLPVIATENTGGPDIIEDGENGFVIPIRDVEAIKEKLQYFYDNPEERKRMGQNAKETVKTGFTWDDYGDRIVNAYTKTLNNSD